MEKKSLKYYRNLNLEDNKCEIILILIPLYIFDLFIIKLRLIANQSLLLIIFYISFLAFTIFIIVIIIIFIHLFFIDYLWSFDFRWWTKLIGNDLFLSLILLACCISINLHSILLREEIFIILFKYFFIFNCEMRILIFMLVIIFQSLV